MNSRAEIYLRPKVEKNVYCQYSVTFHITSQTILEDVRKSYGDTAEFKCSRNSQENILDHHYSPGLLKQ